MLSDREIEKKLEKGIRLNLKDRVQLLPLNEEASEIVALLLPNCKADGTGLFKLDIPSFFDTSRVFKHRDVRNNMLKVQLLYDDLNREILNQRESRRRSKQKKETH